MLSRKKVLVPKASRVKWTHTMQWKHSIKGVIIKNSSLLLKKCNGISITETMETAKQRFTMLATRLKKLAEAQAKTINYLIFKNCAIPAAMQKYSKSRPTKS